TNINVGYFTKLIYNPNTSKQSISKIIIKMKKIVYLFALLVFTFIYSNSYGQLVVKNFSVADSKIGGECRLLTSTIDVKGDIASKTFEVDVIESGNYYLNVLQNYYSNKKIKVKVDDAAVGDVESTKKEGLDVYSISDGSALKLTKGKHLIKFELADKLIPQIDYICFSKEAGKSNFDLTTIKNEQKELKSKDLKDYNKEDAKNAWLALSSGGPQKTVSIITGFPKSYDYAMDVNYKYTYFANLYFTAGQSIVLETYSSNCDPVMELVSEDCQYSWVNDDYSGYESRISITAPVTGVYYVRVRPYSSNSYGISNVNINGNALATNVPIQWTYVNVVNQAADGIERNYFSAKHDGESIDSYDTYMWIEDGTTLPGKILARNDDYSGTGDFGWAYTSRIKKSFSSTIRNVWINAYSQYNESNCDVYLKAPNSTITSYFENLKSDDAIQSALESNSYNCASWGGGRYDLGRYFWASSSPTTDNLSSNWYVSGNFWQSWDNFFGNNPLRFVGAPAYTREGATASNGEVAMWYNSTSGVYTHFSVNKLANEQTHGYDWESKPGGLMRTFHPKDALNSNTYNGYGQISLYYKRVNPLLKVYSLKESIKLGLTVLADTKLNDTEKNEIVLRKNAVDLNQLTSFDEKMKQAVVKINSPELVIQSNPYLIYETDEFKYLLKYCKSKGETIWPLLFENIFKDNSDEQNLSILLLNEIAPDYKSLMQEVRKEWSTNNYTSEGSYIAPSPIENTKNYV
ncbi:MAG TPA: hypothetical protein VFD03_01735, partial [Clostridia bacterium]|nr:hypothetical protein [Clostridia bacterium]